MKKIIFSFLGLMLAGQAWAQETGLLEDNSGWVVEGINNTSLSYELYEDEIIITTVGCENIWDAQFVTPSWKNIGKEGDRFKLTFDVLYEGEESSATLRIASGKTYPYNPEYPVWENTQIVNDEGFAIVYAPDWEIEEGKWASLTYDYLIGELGADSIRLEIDHGENPGIWHFKNFVLEVEGEVKYEYLLPSSGNITSIINGIKYKITDSTAIVIGNTLSDSVKSVTIPSSITIDSIEYNVTAIGNSAFTSCNYLDTVIISDSIKTIGNSAFKRCFNLTSITIPSSVTSIGDKAFYECEHLDSVIIPDSVKTIGDEVFYGCSNLTSVVISKSVTSIGEKMFFGCSKLDSVTIPDSVKTIGNYAFADCFGLKSAVIPNSTTSIGDYAFNRCDGLTSVTIPNSVTSIGDNAFGWCYGLTSVTIPNSVTSIGDYVFNNCARLTSVTIPESVTNIGEGVFASCRLLDSVIIPNSVTSIGNRAFENCYGLTSVTIPNSVTSIGDEAFDGCSGLTSLNIPETVTTIGDLAFNEVPLITYYGQAEGQPWGGNMY